MDKSSKFNLKLDEFFSKIEFKEVANPEMESTLTQDEIKSFNELQILLAEIKQIFDKTILLKSKYVVNINLLYSIFEHFKITRETVNIEPLLGLGYNKFELIFDVFDLIKNPLIIDNYSKLILLSEKYFQSNCKLIDCSVIASVFYDYSCLIKTKEIYDKLDFEIKSEVTMLFSDLETSIRNVHAFWDSENVRNDLGKKAIIPKGKESPIQYHFSSRDVKSIEDSISKFLKIESEVLKGKLTKETFGILVDVITISKSINFTEKTLEGLVNAFSDDLMVSASKKALFLNEVLVLYQHPVGLSEIEADNLLNKNNSFTEDSLKRQIIRNVKSIIKNL